MELGAFSMSLPVKDLAASRAFYEKLGFAEVAGAPDQGWLILRNGTCTLGLFQRMFERPMLTFNPGWVSESEHLSEFEDVRDLQQRLKSAGIDVGPQIDPASTDPASFTVTDPDGNPVLIDQHLPAPRD